MLKLLQPFKIESLGGCNNTLEKIVLELSGGSIRKILQLGKFWKFSLWSICCLFLFLHNFSLSLGSPKREDILLLTIGWSDRSIGCFVGSVTASKLNYQILNLSETLPLLTDDLVSHGYIRGYNRMVRVWPSFFHCSFPLSQPPLALRSSSLLIPVALRTSKLLEMGR